MLAHFLSIKANKKNTVGDHGNATSQTTQNIFESLKISEHKEFCVKHQNKYPIIFVSFKDIKKSTYEDAYSDIQTLIQKLYGEHRYLLEKDTLYDNEKKIYNDIINKKANASEISNAIFYLIKYLHKYHKQKPIILLDEYDTPIQASYLNDYYDKMIELMRGILGSVLKDNIHLYKGIVTGIARISQESLFSGVNNLVVYSVLDNKYGQYFGFLEKEVKELLDKSNVALGLEEMREWYNGYQIGNYVIYNPWSILNCLHYKGKLEPYWLNTSSNELLVKLIGNAKPQVKMDIEALLQGQIIEQPISKNLVFLDIARKTEALWSLLIYAGYLKVLSVELKHNKYMAQIAIPNKEVSFVYDNIVEDWFDLDVDFATYKDFALSLIKGDIVTFKRILSEYIIQTGSYFDFNAHTPERVFHVFILGLVAGLKDRYIITSNRESGYGRSDVVLMSKPDKTDKDGNKLKGIVLEFKVADEEELAELNKKSSEALLQIKKKEYFETFKQHDVKTVLALGLAFCGKKVEIAEELINLTE